MTKNPIIVALDVNSASKARDIVAALGDAVDFYKVGMELYAAEGMSAVHELTGLGKQVFLDLKLYDIGETVKRATAEIARSNATFLTVHGSQVVMRAATEGRGNAGLKLLGVSVLTSFDRQDLADLGFPCSVSDLVALRAKNAMAAGVEGVVCSALEAARVRAITGPGAIIVTPGVRSRSADAGDQKQVATPAEAVAAGADHVVIGREITRANDPRREVSRILSDIACATESATVIAAQSR
jgi:orotidine-5'-phosphate decarboxylase